MRGVLRTSGEKRWMEGDTKEKMCHVPPSPLTQRLGSVLTLVPRSGSEHQTMDVGLLARSPVAKQPRKFSTFSRVFLLPGLIDFFVEATQTVSTRPRHRPPCLWSAHRCSSFVEERSRNTRGARPTIIQRKGVMGRFNLSATAFRCIWCH
jgi:hypothetical protein